MRYEHTAWSAVRASFQELRLVVAPCFFCMGFRLQLPLFSRARLQLVRELVLLSVRLKVPRISQVEPVHSSRNLGKWAGAGARARARTLAT